VTLVLLGLSSEDFQVLGAQHHHQSPRSRQRSVEMVLLLSVASTASTAITAQSDPFYTLR
jgi:hypothetical protein